MLVVNKTLIQLTAVLLLCAVSFNAMADWVKLLSFGYATVYVDPDTIRRSGNLVKMWQLQDLTAPEASSFGTYLSIQIRSEYDCTEERVRQLDSGFYTDRMARGNEVASDHKVGQWVSVPPQTLDAIMIKVACDVR